MALIGKRRKLERVTSREEECKWIDVGHEEFETAGMTSSVNFPILELPTHLIYDILSRLPSKSICRSKIVCKTFLRLLKDPYFAQVHLDQTSSTTVSLALHKRMDHQGFLYFHLLDLDEASRAASCSTDCHHNVCHTRNHPHPQLSLTAQNADFYFSNMKATVVGSCNGLLCLYDASRNSYCIFNPILGEYVRCRYLSPSTPAYTYFNHSGFGFCPKSRQYKVIRFTCLTSVDSLTSLTKRDIVVEVHTLGSEVWRRIYNAHAPCPKNLGSFDPFLNGSFHWITDSCKPSDLICSLDLENECLRLLPPPHHFSQHYTNKINWITIGTLGGCLCLCYVYENNLFEVWVMKDYGMKESWAKEFSIAINFYSGLRVEHLNHPIKFLSNGDLWLILDNSIVSYSPRAGTFKDVKILETRKTEVIVHIPSFISLKHTLDGKSIKVKSFERAKPAKMSTI